MTDNYFGSSASNNDQGKTSSPGSDVIIALVALDNKTTDLSNKTDKNEESIKNVENLAQSIWVIIALTGLSTGIALLGLTISFFTFLGFDSSRTAMEYNTPSSFSDNSRDDGYVPITIFSR